MSPKALDTDDMIVPLGTFVLTMIDSKVIAVTNIGQVIVATPALRAMIKAFKCYFAAPPLRSFPISTTSLLSLMFHSNGLYTSSYVVF